MSDAADASVAGSGERAKKRGIRPGTVVIIALLTLLAAGGIFWRGVSVTYCTLMARLTPAKYRSVIAWNALAAAELGPRALPGLCRIVESPEIARAWPGGAGIYAIFRDQPEHRDAVRRLLFDPRLRVRGAAGMVLVSGPWNEPAGLPAALEALRSEDRDLRFFAAYYLTWYPLERLEAEAPDAPAVAKAAVLALHEGVGDSRAYSAASRIAGTGLIASSETVDRRAGVGLERWLGKGNKLGRDEVAAMEPATLLALVRERHASGRTDEGTILVK